MAQFTNVALPDIVRSSTNPRKHFDQKQLDDLTESIRAKGVINPLLVRPIEGGGYELVAGERRLRACQALELPDVPAIVRELTDEEMLEIQVIENLQRADVHPLDEAEGYAQLMAKNHYDQQKIAEKVGKSVVYVYQRLQLSALIDPMKKLFWEDRVTVTHAIHIARLSAEHQEKVHAYLSDEIRYRDTAPSMKRLQEFIQSNIYVSLSSAPWKLNDETLSPKAGSCAACTKRTGCNKELFDDIKKGDMCLDAKCFKRKKALYIQKRIDEAKEKGVEMVRISDSWSTTKSAIGYNDYTKVTAQEAKKDPDVKQAIRVDGKEAGSITYVKLKKGTPANSEEKAKACQREKEKREKEELHRKIEHASRRMILAAIIDKINTTLSESDIMDICAKLYQEQGWEMHRVLEIEELDDKHARKIEDGFMRAKAIIPKDAFQLNKLLMRLALYDTTTTQWNSFNDVTPLNDAAARYGVNVEEIRAEVKKEFGVEEKPAMKKSKKGAGNGKK